MVRDEPVQQRLQQIAARLTADHDLQKDLLQIMRLHLARAEADDPGRPLSWYFKGCEFRARNYLRQGRSIDSLKRAGGARSWDQGGEQGAPAATAVLGNGSSSDDCRAELISADIVELIKPHLNDRQRASLELLLQGYGIRQTARALGVSHPAVIKHRRKIARIAARYMRTEGNHHGLPVRLPGGKGDYL